jgi:hypothetical protein
MMEQKLSAAINFILESGRASFPVPCLYKANTNSKTIKNKNKKK